MPTKHIYPQKVIAIFEKSLEKSDGVWLSYETRLADEWGNEEAVSVTLEIQDLANKELTNEWWETHQPNALQILKGKNAKLVMFYGLGEGMGKDTKQEIILSKDKDAFIHWRIEDLAFLNGVADALKRKGRVWIKLDMFCDDTYFDDYATTERYSVNLYKISINFADKEI